jgi:hypothetical protein
VVSAGLVTGVVLAVAALDRGAASQRSDTRAAAAQVAPAYVIFSSALH